MKHNIDWFNEESSSILNKGYLLKGETVEDAIERIARVVEKYNPEVEGIYEKTTEAIVKGWLSMSSPIWANAGTERGLPISCFNVHIEDSVESYASKLGEVIMQTKVGGGTSGSFDMREFGAPITDNGHSNGVMAFINSFDHTMKFMNQGNTRRGSFAAYLKIDHPDIEKFLNVKSVGDDNQSIFTGVIVTDEWFEQMMDQENVDTYKRNIWAKVLKSRQEKGIPYVFFDGNVQRGRPDAYKELGLTISGSNLCAEVMLPSSQDESFICALLSTNMERWDEWRNTDLLFTANCIIDAILQEFIDKAKGRKHFEPTVKFAERHRAVGIGVLGYHSYLQKNNIPFESDEARAINREYFKELQEKLYQSSEKLGELKGHAPIFNETTSSKPRRNVTLMAIAPTTSSSAILGQVSAGIEPYSSNYYKVGLAKGNFMRKNKYLEKLLDDKGLNTKSVWKTIMLNDGSVQHLSGLTEHEKNVFKTFKEISQKEIIIHASIRQRWIDQGQSLNLNIPPDVPMKEVNKLMIDAYYAGIKTLYYQRSKSVSKDMLKNVVNCSSCEA